MTTEDPIPLRGHHLRNVGKAYLTEPTALSAFEIRAYSFLEDLIKRPEQKVILVDNDQDAICYICYSMKRPGEASCFSEEASENGDRHVAGLIGLEIGQIYSIREILEAIDKNKDNKEFLPLGKAS